MNGVVQGWRIESGQVVGGDTLTTYPNAPSIAYCGVEEQKFHVMTRNPTALFSQDGAGWIETAVTEELLNNGCHGDQHFFHGTKNDVNKYVYHWDGGSFTRLRNLGNKKVQTADIAVDGKGHAWVPIKESEFNSTIEVYDKNGLVDVYVLGDDFDQYLEGHFFYGACFVRDTLYFAGGLNLINDPQGFLLPIVLEDYKLRVLDRLDFEYEDYGDLAGIKKTRSTPILNAELNCLFPYPNPTAGFFRVATTATSEANVSLMTIHGQWLEDLETGREMDITRYAAGSYLLVSEWEGRRCVEMIVKVD